MNDEKKVGPFDGKSDGKLDAMSVRNPGGGDQGVKVVVFVLHGDSEGAVEEKSEADLIGPLDDK